jgi:hypothetical protein
MGKVGVQIRALYCPLVYLRVDEIRRWARDLGCASDVMTTASFQNIGRMGVTKITNNMVTVGVPLATPRAGDRTFGYRARAVHCGGPDVEDVSSTVPDLGRYR